MIIWILYILIVCYQISPAKWKSFDYQSGDIFTHFILVLWRNYRHIYLKWLIVTQYSPEFININISPDCYLIKHTAKQIGSWLYLWSPEFTNWVFSPDCWLTEKINRSISPACEMIRMKVNEIGNNLLLINLVIIGLCIIC